MPDDQDFSHDRVGEELSGSVGTPLPSNDDENHNISKTKRLFLIITACVIVIGVIAVTFLLVGELSESNTRIMAPGQHPPATMMASQP